MEIFNEFQEKGVAVVLLNTAVDGVTSETYFSENIY